MDELTRGERGRKGDTGERGQTGAAGVEGHEGERGRRGPIGELPGRVIASFVAVVAVAALLVGVLGYIVIRVGEQADALEVRAAENAKALDIFCAHRSNLRKSIADREEALAARAELDDEAIAERLGVPRALIESGRKRDEAALERERIELATLQPLDCPPGGG